MWCQMCYVAGRKRNHIANFTICMVWEQATAITLILLWSRGFVLGGRACPSRMTRNTMAIVEQSKTWDTLKIKKNMLFLHMGKKIVPHPQNSIFLLQTILPLEPCCIVSAERDTPSLLTQYSMALDAILWRCLTNKIVGEFDIWDNIYSRTLEKKEIVLTRFIIINNFKWSPFAQFCV